MSNIIRAVQPQMAGAKEVGGLHYLLSKTKALNSGGVTVELICVFISQICFTFSFCL